MYRELNFSFVENKQIFGNKKLPYFYGVVRIGDFMLYKNDKQKIIDNAKVGIAIYGIEKLEQLHHKNKKIIVVIPALTGNARLFDDKASQGSGWANNYAKSSNILNPFIGNIIIGIDYFGGPYDSSSPDKHDLNFYPVPPQKQVEAWKKALKKLGITNIEMLLGGSNGGGHIHTWIFDNELLPKYLIPISGPVSPLGEAREFFSLQIDLGEKNIDIRDRLKNNLSNLIGKSVLYDHLVDDTILKIRQYLKTKDKVFLIKLLRQIGFLKFLNPSFFDRFYFDKNGNRLQTLDKAKENLISYFINEGNKFENRFSLSSLLLLTKGIVEAQYIDEKQYVSLIHKEINIIVVGIEDDMLFLNEPMKQYFDKVSILREIKGDTGFIKFINIESNDITKKAGHDSFLWETIIDEISENIQKVIK